MQHSLNKDNPLMHQHVIHVGRHEILRQFHSRNAFPATAPQPITVNRKVISINDCLQEEMAMSEVLGCTDVLYVRCQDDDSMTAEQAYQIWHFVTRLHPTANFVVHCYLGISRSAAVAKWIAETLNIQDAELQSYKGFNQHIYDMLHSMSNPEIRLNAELSVTRYQD